MIVSIHQPAYLPWLGYFERIALSDLHIVLDHVQFEKNSFINRNRILGSQGAQWVTLPVRSKGRFGDLPINAVELDGTQHWAAKHWQSIKSCYGRAPHFAAEEGYWRDVYARPWTGLSGLVRETTDHQLRALGITTPVKYSSQMAVEGAKAELVLNLCRACGATTYLSGPLGRDYLDERPFLEAGIRVEYHDYRHPEYRQVFPGFTPFLAAVDLLFNHGPESARILRTAPGRPAGNPGPGLSPG